MFIALLRFSRSIATEYVSIINEPCVTRPTLIDLCPVGLNFYPFMISLERSNGSYNTTDDLSSKICFPNKIKDVNVKVLNIITRIIQ